MTQNTVWDDALIDSRRRFELLGCKGITLWMTGLSGSGKSTIAKHLERALLVRGVRTYRLDGDNLRHGLNHDLGFSPEDRSENVRRTAEVSALLADSGCVVIASLISPLRCDRKRAREIHEQRGLSWREIWVDTPLAVCEARDPKGLYQRAREGEIKSFTGIDAPYEAPQSPHLHLRTESQSLEQCVQECERLLVKSKAIEGPRR